MSKCHIDAEVQLLSPSCRKGDPWIFKLDGKVVVCTMEDNDFFNKYVTNKIKLGGNEFMRVQAETKVFIKQDIRLELKIKKVFWNEHIK